MNAEIRASFDGGTVRYESRRRDPRGGEGAFAGSYRPEGGSYLAQPGSLEHWLTERYCLYAVTPRGRVRRGEVHHVQWPLRRASAEIEVNTVAEAQGFELVGPAEHLHFVDRIDVLAWWPEDA